MDIPTFPMGISPKVNLITRLEFELAYYNVEVKFVSQEARKIPPERVLVASFLIKMKFCFFFVCLKEPKFNQKYKREHTRQTRNTSLTYCQVPLTIHIIVDEQPTLFSNLSA